MVPIKCSILAPPSQVGFALPSRVRSGDSSYARLIYVCSGSDRIVGSPPQYVLSIGMALLFGAAVARWLPFWNGVNWIGTTSLSALTHSG